MSPRRARLWDAHSGDAALGRAARDGGHERVHLAAYAVDAADTGEDALWSALENDYDAVVLDAMIPTPDGFEVPHMRAEGFQCESRTGSLPAPRASTRTISCRSPGLVPLLGPAEQTRLPEIIAEKVAITTPRIRSGAANPMPKLLSVVAGMCAGADSIDDLDVLRAGGMPILCTGVYAPSTLGTLLREFTVGHGRQLESVLREHLVAPAGDLAGTVEDQHLGGAQQPRTRRPISFAGTE